MPIRTEQREDGKLFAVAGRSRSGKTAWTLQRVAGAPRVLVRDPRLEYVGPLKARAVESVGELARLLRNTGDQEGRFCYTGPDSGFDALCKLAFAWGQLWPIVFIGEEISDVTTPGKAPDWWGQLIRKGLYYGNHIYSITQRPAECDKTVWGNASVIHTHGFVRQEDREYMARQLGCDVALINGLQQFEYLEKTPDSAEIYQGKVSFS